MGEAAVGVLLRQWRARRRVSQLGLALDVGVSARHLSFVESGRSRPSAELLIALTDGLNVPLRERNTLLLAAGYAPRYPAHALDDAALRPARDAIQRLLDAHDPYPGVLIDRCWNVLAANAAARSLMAGIPAELLGPPANVYRMCLHPDGLAARTVNFEDWASYLLAQLRRTIAVTGDPTVLALDAEVRAYPNVARGLDAVGESASLLVPLVLDADGRRLSMFTTLTTFGTPLDVTLDELAVELFYPADDSTATLLREMGESSGRPGWGAS